MVLEPLFADALNTQRENDVFNLHVEGFTDTKIPYLNGGLFERDELDAPKSVFPAAYFESLFEFLSQYNFTIDENDPNDAEMGIDPEMLGRIFENLLEDNKDKGAFYTPKEIVQYMCRESLIAYLTTCVMKRQGEDHQPEDKIRDAVRELLKTPETIVPKMSEEHLEDFGTYIRMVKICDPAIGSGAFPMGLLNELVRCRASIGAWATDAQGTVLTGDYAALKAEIICNNIYGVDIEKGAVDIARLRFWLSIIVDEQSPHALPNFDYKFMQGNSLLEQFEGIDLSNIYDEPKCGEQINMAFDEETNALGELRQYMTEYFSVSEHKRKKELRDNIGDSVRRLVCAKTTKEEIRDKISAIDPTANTQFFLWHTWFADVFEKGGFDIVIGNPPYFVYEGKNKGEIATLKVLPQYKIALGGKLNAYKLFLAHALNCLVKESGSTCFIFQNSFMADIQAANLREYILNNCQILSINSFPERDSKKKRVFESVKMSVCILLVRNKNHLLLLLLIFGMINISHQEL